MRLGLLAVALCAASGSAYAEIVTTPNHLDCVFNETSQALVCPEVPSGRASAVPAPAPVAVPAADPKPGKPEKGTAEWNAHCASKYKSFDADTGMYKSYSGKMRPCV